MKAKRFRFARKAVSVAFTRKQKRRFSRRPQAPHSLPGERTEDQGPRRAEDVELPVCQAEVADAFFVVAHLLEASGLAGLVKTVLELGLVHSQLLREITASELGLAKALRYSNYFVRRDCLRHVPLLSDWGSVHGSICRVVVASGSCPIQPALRQR